jgi:hypothetical protein
MTNHQIKNTWKQVPADLWKNMWKPRDYFFPGLRTDPQDLGYGIVTVL